MPSLRDTMAEHGFESNDDYEFQLRCLLESPARGIRTLNIEGDGGRQKTAFAVALGRSLRFQHLLYHDFTDAHPPVPEVVLPPSRDELGREEPPIEPLDQIVSEACAQSEGDPTLLILDQLQVADFREHIRIHRLVADAYWDVGNGRYFANPSHLLLFLISEEPLYHALQKESFRIWINRLCERQLAYEARAFGLDPEAQPLLDALARLFDALEVAPTRSELIRLLSDLQLHIRSVEQLRLSLYGRIEGMDRARLGATDLQAPLSEIIQAAQALLVTEHIELSTHRCGEHSSGADD